MFYQDVKVDGYSSIVKAFCIYFKSLFLFNEVETLPHCTFYDAPLFEMPRITPEKVYAELSQLSTSTSTGTDNLPAIFLIKCAEVLCVPISDLFNFSIDSGVYPDVFKYNNIIPIFKKIQKPTSKTTEVSLLCLFWQKFSREL